MKYIDTGKLLYKQFKNNEFLRYDVIVRYLFIREFYIKGKPENFEHGLYNKLVKARGKKNKRNEFIKLIASFEKDGFLEKYPLVVKRNLCMCGGSHRMACCLWFNIKKVPIIFNKKDNKIKQLFTEKWMIEKGFDDIMPKLKYFKNIFFYQFDVNGNDKHKKIIIETI